MRRGIQSPRGAQLKLTFYGVRGSTPCASELNAVYGGNTACVVVEAEHCRPIIFDLGTGLRFFGLTRPVDEPFTGVALLSHLHWDHVQGIPFFTPLLRDGSRLDVYGPPQVGSSLEAEVRSFIHPPYFPVEIEDLPGEIAFHEVLENSFEVDEMRITTAPVPHTGLTLGFRVEHGGATVVYATDHQQPGLDSTFVDPGVLDLCRGADVLIHDAQFTRDEFEAKSTWGHCTFDYAVEVAAQAGVDTLILFHHDPDHSDADMDQIQQAARELGQHRGVRQVVASAEGLSLDVVAGADRITTPG